MILRRLLLTTAFVVGMAACSSPESPPTSSHQPPTTGIEGTPSAPAPPVPPGETVEILTSGGTVRLTLLSVDVATSCPGRASPTQNPANGYFVVLELDASFESPASGGGAAPVGPDVFRVIGPDGTPQAVSNTEASWACFDADRLLPGFVDASAPQTGVVVLDSRTEHGSVVYLLTEDPEWSWEF